MSNGVCRACGSKDPESKCIHPSRAHGRHEWYEKIGMRSKKLIVHFKDGATSETLYNVKSIIIDNKLKDEQLVIEDTEDSWHWLDNIEYIEVKDE